METKTLIKNLNLNDFRKQHHRFQDEDCVYDLNIQMGKIFCTIEMSTKIKASNNSEAIVNRLSEINPLFRYSLSNKELKCSTTLWIDISPSQKAYAEVISMLLSSIKSAKLMCEVSL